MHIELQQRIPLTSSVRTEIKRFVMRTKIPKTKKGMLRFLGAVNFHRRHLQDIATIAAPLYKLTSAKADFTITDKEIQVFERIKQMITEAPALALPDRNRPFVLTTDASDIGAGGMLTQQDDDGNEQVVAYTSRIFTANEQNGSSCEKNC